MSFGALTDYIGAADTKYQLQSSAKNPASSGNAQVQDEDGTTVCETVYGQHDVWVCGYEIVSNTKDTAGTYVPLSIDTKAMIGSVIAIDTTVRALVTGIELGTSQTERPQFSVTAEEFEGDTSDVHTFASGVTVIGIKRAQALGFVADTDSYITSSSLSLSGQTAPTLGATGARVNNVVYQGRAEATGELASCSATPGAAADTGWTLATDPSFVEENTAYGTSSVAVFKNITASV